MRIRGIWLIVTFVTLVFGPALAGWYIREARNDEYEATPVETARLLAEKGNEDGALSVYEFAVNHGLDPDGSAMASYSGIIARRNQITTKILATAKGGFSGFFTGEVRDPASLVGCVAGDLTSIGDIRDLAKNGYVYLTGGEPDVVVTALSTIGLASTLAPHVDVGVSALKNLYKFMGRNLRAGLKLVIDEAKATGNLEKLSGLAGSMGKTWNALGMGTLDLVRLSGNMETLGKLTKAVDLYGRPAFGMMMTGGRKAVGFLEMAVDGGFKLAGEPGRRMIRFAVRYPMMGARILKIARKAGWDNLDAALVGLAELLVMVDSRVLVGLGLLLWTWCFWLDVLNVLFFPLFLPIGEVPGH